MPLSDALGAGVGITPAYATLKQLVGKTTATTGGSKNKRKKRSSYESSSDDEVIQQNKTTKQRKQHWMTLDKIDPDRYFRRKIIGRGDVLAQLNNQVPVIGEKSQYGDTTVPEFKQRGPRKMGGAQPGSEMLNFFPVPTIYSLVKAVQIIHTLPTNITHPAFNDTIQLDIEQQPGIFMDGREFILEAELEMYYNNVPWIDPTNGLGEAYRKCISPVNNVLSSLFKSLIVTANNQPVITYEYSTMDYMRMIYQTTTDSYKNGDMVPKGFFKETAGHLGEWDGLTGSTYGNPPVNTKNEGRQELLRLFWDGKKVKLRTNILFPVTESLDKSPLNSANRIGFTFQRNPNTFYLLTGPNNAAAVAPMPKDLATKAANCKIRINEISIKTRMLEYEEPVLE